jgi:protein-disulfide isomerase
MRVKEAGSHALVIVSVLCGVTATAIMVRNEFFPKAGRRAAESKPVEVKNWAEYAAVGHRLGSTDAPVTILEFADFECPVCRTYNLGPLKAVRDKFPGEVAVVFRNWPLKYHRFAMPSARAAECAADQGRFEQFHDLLYVQQDSLGLKSYDEFARESGVPSLPAFQLCNSLRTPVAAIDADVKAAAAIGGTGTPTIVINGLRLNTLPDTTDLERYVREALAIARPKS